MWWVMSGELWGASLEGGRLGEMGGSGRAPHDAHLMRDEAAPKMGHPVGGGEMCKAGSFLSARICLASQSFRHAERGRHLMFTPALISIIVTLIVIGLLLYLIGLIPMDGTIKQIIRVVVIIAVIVWLLQSFGLLGSLGHGHLTR